VALCFRWQLNYYAGCLRFQPLGVSWFLSANTLKHISLCWQHCLNADGLDGYAIWRLPELIPSLLSRSGCVHYQVLKRVAKLLVGARFEFQDHDPLLESRYSLRDLLTRLQ